MKQPSNSSLISTTTEQKGFQDQIWYLSVSRTRVGLDIHGGLWPVRPNMLHQVITTKRNQAQWEGDQRI